MGQIQSAINAGIGSIIGAKAMAEHLQGQALNAIEGEYKEAKEIGKDAVPLAAQISKETYKENSLNKALRENYDKLKIEHPRDEKTGRFVNKKEYQRKLEKDISEAQKALFDVHQQQKVTSIQRKEFNARLDMYNTRQGLIQKSLDRLPAKNRPESPDLDNILPPQQWSAVDLIKRNNKENK